MGLYPHSLVPSNLASLNFNYATFCRYINELYFLVNSAENI